MITEEQRKQRMKGIGGSDAPAILGISPWSTPLDVYFSKVGVEPESVPVADLASEIRKDLGNELESAILRRWSKLEGKPVECPPTLVHPDLPWMLGNVDGLVGTDEGVEAKLVLSPAQAARLGPDFTDEGLPEHVVQCHHYLAVTGRKRWHLVYFDPQKGLRRYIIDRDAGLQKMLIERERDFWGCVEARKPPIETATVDDIDNLMRVFGRDNGSLLEATPYQMTLAQQYQEARLREKAASDEKRALYGELAREIGAASGFAWEGGKVTWKAAKKGPPNYKDLSLRLGATIDDIEQSGAGIGARRMLVKIKGAPVSAEETE